MASPLSRWVLEIIIKNGLLCSFSSMFCAVDNTSNPLVLNGDVFVLKWWGKKRVMYYAVIFFQWSMLYELHKKPTYLSSKLKVGCSVGLTYYPCGVVVFGNLNHEGVSCLKRHSYSQHIVDNFNHIIPKLTWLKLGTSTRTPFPQAAHHLERLKVF